ncbi:MAG: sigma-70 family RNA polymerase sigma factor [Ignavibacteria bacterium]|nr:sigma-70 family RNA polymerase sigma factor [Ignavibacteria bacterium]
MANDKFTVKNTASKTEDNELIDRALSGDQQAFDKLMKKYYNLVSNLIYRMIYNKEDVDDLTQEAFIKAFNSLDKFDRQFAFSTWLYKIASNNCIDYLRKKKLNTISIDKEFDSDDEDLRFEIPDHETKPDRGIIEDERKKLLDRAIESLPDKYKTVIILRHKEEKEYEEIAEELKLPLGTVKAHIFRGRELLYKYLKDKIKHF